MSEEVSGALPSLISLMVSVDVKPYVLLDYSPSCINQRSIHTSMDITTEPIAAAIKKGREG